MVFLGALSGTVVRQGIGAQEFCGATCRSAARAHDRAVSSHRAKAQIRLKLVADDRCGPMGPAVELRFNLSAQMSKRRESARSPPPHPGGIVRRQCLDPFDLSVTEAAKGLGVTRQALSDLVNGKAGISIDMAIRLSKAFGSSPETWLGLQMAYDLWQARERIRSLKVRHFKAA